MKKLAATILLTAALPVAAQQQTPNMPDPAQMFLNQLDTNKDGKVSAQEFLQPGQQQFNLMDKNRDSFITADEAQAFMQEMQARMQQMQQQQQQKQQQQGGGYGQQYPQGGGYGQQYPQR